VRPSTGILFSTQGFDKGAGSVINARHVLYGLLHSGVQVTVLSHDTPDIPDEVDGLKLTRPTWRRPCVPNEFPRELSVRWPWRLARWGKRSITNAARRARRQQQPPELLVSNGITDYKLTSDRISEARRSIMVVRECMARHALPGQPPAEAFLATMAQYTHLVFITPSIEREWMEHPALASQQSCHIPNCCREDRARDILTETRSVARQRLNLDDGQFIVACVGSIQFLKGQDILLGALKQASSDCPEIHGLLVGAPGGVPGREWGMRFLDGLKSDPAGRFIHCLGYRDDAMDSIYAADLLVHPSRCEGLGGVILEAMALGTPVLASRIGGIPDVVDDGRSGMLFEPGNAGELAEALRQLYRDSALRAKLAKAGQERYWSCYTRRQLVLRYTAAVNHILGGGKWDECFQAKLDGVAAATPGPQAHESPMRAEGAPEHGEHQKR